MDTLTGENRVLGSGLDPTWSPDGRWIAYRTRDGKIALLDFQSGRTDSRKLGADVDSFAHWTSRFEIHLRGAELTGAKIANAFRNSRFVVYEVATGKSDVIYDRLAGTGDWNFGWIAQLRGAD